MSVDPFAGMEVIASSAPSVEAVYVSQPTDQPPTHRVKLAATVKRGQATLYAFDCICGYSSPLCESQGRANELYREHKAG